MKKILPVFLFLILLALMGSALADTDYVTYTNDDVFILDPQQVTLQADESNGISDINAASAVSVKYVNAMGQTSDRPFQGVNIVITRNADGTTSTSKVVK